MTRCFSCLTTQLFAPEDCCLERNQFIIIYQQVFLDKSVHIFRVVCCQTIHLYNYPLILSTCSRCISIPFNIQVCMSLSLNIQTVFAPSFFRMLKKTRNNNLRKELCKFQMSESLTDRYTYTSNTTRSPGTSHITTSTSTWMFGETTISRIYTVILMFFLFWTVQKDRIFRHFVQNQFLGASSSKAYHPAAIRRFEAWQSSHETPKLPNKKHHGFWWETGGVWGSFWFYLGLCVFWVHWGCKFNRIFEDTVRPWQSNLANQWRLVVFQIVFFPLFVGFDISQLWDFSHEPYESA